jgi:prevent-host-death family protein
MTIRKVGIRSLKARLSSYLRQVKEGGSIVITEHGKPIGQIVPVKVPKPERVRQLIQAGIASWSGQKLRPVRHRPRVRGKRTVADLLVENRE